jgi:ABC-type glutathione transport system ATPase component
MLAGFEEPTSGRIFLDGQDMTGVPPYERPVHMMFQSYALFPHMTVEKNIAYGLKHEPMTEASTQGPGREMLDLVQLTPLPPQAAPDFRRPAPAGGAGPGAGAPAEAAAAGRTPRRARQEAARTYPVRADEHPGTRPASPSSS